MLKFDTTSLAILYDRAVMSLAWEIRARYRTMFEKRGNGSARPPTRAEANLLAWMASFAPTRSTTREKSCDLPNLRAGKNRRDEVHEYGWARGFFRTGQFERAREQFEDR